MRPAFLRRCLTIIALEATVIVANSGFPSVTKAVTASPTSPCALVSSSSSAQKLATPTVVPTVSAKLAHDCLNSVPINKTAALELLDSIEPYLEWQTDTAWIKDPPDDYDYPPHDVFSAIASIREKVVGDHYDSEYVFQNDLYLVFLSSHNGHFAFYPDALTKAFEFRRQRSLVSLSEDGLSLPVIKLFEDVIYTPNDASIVTKINGVDAVTYVTDYINNGTSQQDMDSAYNTMFFEKASYALTQSNGYFSSGGRVRFIYPGPNTTFTFENGTSLTFENLAKVIGDFTNVNSGQSFYEKFCNSNESMIASNTMNAASSSGPLSLVPGYPPAVVKTNGTEVSGYYIDGNGFEDVAVLSVLTFEADSPVEFQKVIETFLSDATRDGKKKLVIDLSQNPGGYVFAGYDLFRQLFPDIVQDGNSRWRVNNMFESIAEVYSAISENIDPGQATETQVTVAESSLTYRQDLNMSNLPFTSFDAKFGPTSFRGDNFTNLMRWNLNDPLLTSNVTFGYGTDITGYGSRRNLTRTFAPEDIVMLQDGLCASTCTIFSEFMRSLAGVKTVAFGGRPKEGPMQGVGGVKGSQILTWDNIFDYAQIALKNATADQTKNIQRLTTLPMRRSRVAACNVRDAIYAKNVNDGLPAQFVRQEADCRLFYREAMINDVTALWKAAADSAFNGKKCANGGFPETVRDSSAYSNPTGIMIEKTKFVEVTQDKPVKSNAWLAVHHQKAID